MKNLKHIIILFIALLFPLTTNSQSNVSKKKIFAQIEKIYIEDDPYGTPQEKSIRPFLKTELTKIGFIIVENKNDADAILSGEGYVEITLHGNKNDSPDKAIYRYRIKSLNDRRLWKTKVSFISKSNWAENNKFGAEKIVEKLYIDWQRAKNRFLK